MVIRDFATHGILRVKIHFTRQTQIADFTNRKFFEKLQTHSFFVLKSFDERIKDGAEKKVVSMRFRTTDRYQYSGARGKW